MIPDEFSKYIKTQEFKDLLAKYEQALLDGGNEFFDCDDLLDIAEYYHTKNDIDSASRAAYYCLDLFPGNERALVFAAKCSLLAGDIDEAERICNSIENAEELDAFYLKAELMIIRGNAQEAEKLLVEVFDSLENDEDARLDMILDIPLIYCDYCLWSMAERWLTLPEADEVKEEIDYIESLARIYTYTGRQEEAIPLWNSYIDNDAFSSNAWLLLAQCQHQTGRCQEALQSAEYAISISPNVPDGYLAAGNASFAIGKNAQAIEYFDKFLDLSPGDPMCELLYASILFTEDRYEEANVHIENALNAVPDMSEDEESRNLIQEIYRQAAFINSALGNTAQAIDYIDRLMFYGVNDAAMQLLRAAIYLESRQNQKAFEILNEMLYDENLDSDTFIQIGMMLVDASYFKLGFNLLKTTLTTLEDAGMNVKKGYDRLAYAALVENNYDEFLRALEKSITLLPIETITIFSPFFPEDMPLSEYYDYAKNNRISI